MNYRSRFADRAEAGQVLAEFLREYDGQPDTVVLALPRGGVPVAFEVATALRLPLDVFLVRKLGVPGFEELAMGAIASGGVTAVNQEVIDHLKIAPETFQSVAAEELCELERRERRYRHDRPPTEVAGKTVFLVDDGLATGSTMRAAIAALRKRSPARIVVAVPTAAPATCEEIGRLADECVCAITPDPFHAVGLWYQDFSQTSDEEVCLLLDRADGHRAVGANA